MKELFNTFKASVMAKSDVKSIRAGEFSVPELVGMAEKHDAATQYDSVLVKLWGGERPQERVFPNVTGIAVRSVLEKLLDHGQEGRDAFGKFCEGDPRRSELGLRILEMSYHDERYGKVVPEADEDKKDLIRLATDLRDEVLREIDDIVHIEITKYRCKNVCEVVGQGGVERNLTADL